MFRGNFPAKIDAQGRIKIPSGYRKIFEEKYGPEVYVTSLNGGSVLIYPMSEWEQIEAGLLERPRRRPSKIKFMRQTNFYGQAAVLDKQGRVLIQPRLRESALINGEVAVLGYLTYLEVWNLERFHNLLESDPFTDEDADDLDI